MKQAYFIIILPLAVLSLIFLGLEFSSDQFGPEAIFSILVVASLLAFIFIVMKRPVTKQGIHIRLREYNWVSLAFWWILGGLEISETFRFQKPTYMLFGYLNTDIAFGIVLILHGCLRAIRTIRIDKNRIKIHDLISTKIKYTDLVSVHFTERTITFITDTEEHKFKIQKLSDEEIQEITKRIEEFKTRAIKMQPAIEEEEVPFLTTNEHWKSS